MPDRAGEHGLDVVDQLGVGLGVVGHAIAPLRPRNACSAAAAPSGPRNRSSSARSSPTEARPRHSPARPVVG